MENNALQMGDSGITDQQKSVKDLLYGKLNCLFLL